MTPNIDLLRRASSLMPPATRVYVMAEHGPSKPALLLRQRIGMALAVLEAAETQAGLDPRAAAHCAALRARIAHLPQAWEGAFGFSWREGERLHWLDQAQKRGPAARALYAQAYPQDNRRPLDEWPTWQEARAVCLAIGADAEHEERREVWRRHQIIRAQIRRGQQERAIQAQRLAQMERRRAEWERRRQTRELHEFRTDTQRRVPFPNERRKQLVRSR